MASPCIDESHRKELLKFLLVKTAAVRRGVKPAELLRVRHCPEGGDVCEFLAELARRFVKDGMPHEVGVFVGYPLKDVEGFMRHLPATPLHGRHGAWRVYGNARESVSLMNRYEREESRAADMLLSASGVDDFISKISLQRAS